MSITPAEVRATVRELVGPRSEGVGDDVRLVELGLDSVDTIELALELQDRLGVVLSSADISFASTLGQLVERVVEARR